MPSKKPVKKAPAPVKKAPPKAEDIMAAIMAAKMAAGSGGPGGEGLSSGPPINMGAGMPPAAQEESWEELPEWRKPNRKKAKPKGKK